jgi:ubiquinone/menaquinone biosynthesis C-methylase UbiE
VDINLHQLQQGARIFTSNNINFIYADLFSIKFPRSAFNLITLNSSIQYFPDLKTLIRELLYLLPSYGEIHILDSPFYNDEDVFAIKNKILGNYQLIGFPQMKEKIFFHTYKSLDKFNCRFMYDPRKIVNKFLNIAFSKDSSYPWIIIRK